MVTTNVLADWLNESEKSDRRPLAKLLAAMAAMGLCAFRYTPYRDLVEIWMPHQTEPGYSTSYTLFTFPGAWLHDG